MIALGIDTSNYATSVALVDNKDGRILGHVKLPLPVAEGALGLRQSDAVFAHIKNLPLAFAQLRQQTSLERVDIIGVSARPRDIEGSYMPCFLAGVAAAAPLAAALDIPVIECSHQAGHVMAALYGAGLWRSPSLHFLAFHVSGGTTDALDCRLDGTQLFIEQRGSSLDLFAGQAVDRVGALLGLPFPAGPALSALANTSNTTDYARPVLKGGDCCLSGLQNQCEALLRAGKEPDYIARYCLNSIAATILDMTRFHHGSDIPVLYAGGVLSSDIIRPQIAQHISEALFPEPAWLSSDNAVGTALLACRTDAALIS